jgi:nucleoid-associated protein YgaU
MPVRGLFVVLLLISAVAAGWYVVAHRDQNEPKGSTVSKDITPDNPMTGPEAGLIAPSFAAARVGASGEAVVSGHGEPGATISLIARDRVLGQSPVTQRGEWTIVIDRPLGSGSQDMTARAERPGSSLQSEDHIIVDLGAGHATPLVLDMRFGHATRFLQRPDDLPAAALSVDNADYDSADGIFISGHVGQNAAVRLYLDNQPIGDAMTDAAGDWTFRPSNLAAGAYTLRIDELGPKGLVAARIEVPFERAQAASVAHSLLGDQTLIVQRGDSLWRIARALPGPSYQYTVLYRSGQDQVRDPNLIYPGQVFETSLQP